MNFVINGGFSDCEKVVDILRDDHPLRQYNGLEGCMSGRMAMNTPWECAKIDRVIYGQNLDGDSDVPDTMTREEILLVSISETIVWYITVLTLCDLFCLELRRILLD